MKILILLFLVSSCGGHKTQRCVPQQVAIDHCIALKMSESYVQSVAENICKMNYPYGGCFYL